MMERVLVTRPMSPGGLKAPHTIEGIQYLRGIAACLVAGHHAMSHFGGDVAWDDIFGGRRVDLFFVISGFIMAYTTRNFAPDGDRAQQAWAFFCKRFWRIVPLYWIALALASRSLPLPEVPWGDFLFVPSFHANGHIWPHLIPGWTLNYEMAFYVVFAASMLFGRFRKTAVVLTLAALVLAGLIISPSSAPGLFYTHTVLMEFALGIGVYALMKYPQRAAFMWAALVAGSIVLIVDAAPDSMRGFSAGPAAALVVWSVAVLCQGRRNGPLLAVGESAYTIYLFHGFSFAITSRLCTFAGLTEMTPVNVVIVLTVMVGGAIVAGLILHRWLEVPLLKVFVWRAPMLKLTFGR